jgi:two-component system, cell cycle sensor histidine kinase and response regulator CckA
LRRSEERYRRFFEDDLTGDFITTLDGRFLEVNPAFARIFGYDSPEQVKQVPVSDFYFSGADRAEMIAELNRGGRLDQHERTFRRRDGQAVHGIINTIGEYDDEGKLVRIRGYLFDITDRKELEEQLRHSQKMEAVGRLAGGVAHDFNNMLLAIIGNAALLEEAVADDEEAAEYLMEIHEATERAVGLTRHLLAFGRKQMLQPKVVDLNTVVSGACGLVRRLIPASIHLETELCSTLGATTVDPHQIEQVIVNLVVNARDAMPDGGVITIRTQNVQVTERLLRAHPFLRDGEYVGLSVHDTGSGMEPQVMAKVFEPFYTTKAVGEGTGLGLSTAYGVVKQSGGFIWVDSEPDRGTTFTVLLPREAAPVPPPEPAPGSQPLPKGRGTVLLVEDEAAVREVAKRVLRRSGYDVLEAADGEEALHIADTYPGAIGVLLTDVSMPRMSGHILAERLRERLPSIKVVFMSGYPGDALVRDGTIFREAEFLQKPFAPMLLAETVQRVAGS